MNLNWDDSIAKLKYIEVKLMEEVLLKLGLQRQEKLINYDGSNLSKEFGDVFNSLILLGMALNIDVKKAISERVDEMYQRYGNKS